ncbi:MAG: SAM-dependent methyltransferase [Paenibacillus sp.]|uniref:class I SAM-dependent methyltransferase n=1 Tax=Paenibacillus sp. GCM10012303 TaxID=3317340 RepID=UPI0029E911C7|nr:SAM-dependent methyltransferase [Paenibacillus sp.]
MTDLTGPCPLIPIIRSRIGDSPRSALSFRDYMELCLYHDPLGYYSRDTVKVGKDGDFYTSSSIGTIMGEVLGMFIIKQAQRYDADTPLTIVEWGGGTGRLAGHILDTVAKRSKSLYDRLTYAMVESSPFHRRLQTEQLSPHPAVQHVTPGQSYEMLENGPAIVLSNELLDAFPVHRIERKDGSLYEWFVGWSEESGKFVTRLFPLAAGSRAASYIERESVPVRERQIVDVNPEAADWVKRILSGLREGMLVTIDYGDVAEELYSAHRMQGTFLCYRKHQAFDDPYAYPGEQDMTSHVDFTACIRAGTEAGAGEWSLRTQKQFLIDEGVLELLVAHNGQDPFGPEARRNRAVRQLLVSDSMSELFKVLVQTKKR